MVSQRYLWLITNNISAKKKVPKVVPFILFGTFRETRSLKFGKYLTISPKIFGVLFVNFFDKMYCMGYSLHALGLI